MVNFVASRFTDLTWSITQKMWASSCWKRRTRVRPVRVPDSSFLCRTPKSASLKGSSRHERGLWLNIKLWERNQREVNQTGELCALNLRSAWEVFMCKPPGDAPDLPVAGAVHWLQRKDVIFHREWKHVFTVVLPVARCLPQLAVIDVGGGDFLEASSPVLVLDKQENHTKLSVPIAQVLHGEELNYDFWHESPSHCNKNSISSILFIQFFFPPKEKAATACWSILLPTAEGRWERFLWINETVKNIRGRKRMHAESAFSE